MNKLELEAKYFNAKRVLEDNPKLLIENPDAKKDAILLIMHTCKVSKHLAEKWYKDILPKNSSSSLEFYTDHDLLIFEPKPMSWLIEKQIPMGEVGLLVGKRGERKTFLALKQSICIASGQDCLNDKVPEKKKVLIIDEESGKNEIALRVKTIKKGMGITEGLEITFISFAGLKLDDRENSSYKSLIDLIGKFKPDLIIVDCLARVVSFEIDKDNTSISTFFTEIIRPLINSFGMTWLFIHHLRKTNSNKHIDDPLDEIRGGSELVNYCRFVLMCQAPRGQIKGDDGSEFIIFKVLKMSNAEKEEPKTISFTQTEEGLKINYAGRPEDILSGEVQAGAKIKDYLIENNITEEFKTSYIINSADSIGFKKSLLSYGLNALMKEGFLKKIKRGVWRVAGSENIKEKTQTKLNDNNKSKKKDKEVIEEGDQP